MGCSAGRVGCRLCGVQRLGVAEQLLAAALESRSDDFTAWQASTSLCCGI